jgi:hypothetical protein
MNINTFEPKDFGIKIAAVDLKTRIDQTRREGAFAGGDVEHRAARQLTQNPNNGFVDCFMRQSRRRLPLRLSGIA